MHLPLSAPWSFRHQYNLLPQAAWGTVKEAFQTWVDNKVVEPGDPSSDFNTPLVVVAKKDLNGLKTSYRVCLDFRHINLLLLQKYTHARERMPLLHVRGPGLAGTVKRLHILLHHRPTSSVRAVRDCPGGAG